MNFNSKLTRRALACAAALGLASALTPVYAQDAYPDKPIKFIVAFPPGGSTDLVTRIVAQRMAELLKQPVVVENKPGAGGNVASQFVARAANDGYTIYLGTLATHGINPVLQKNLPFDHLKDFTMISQLGYYTNLVLVNPDTQAQTLSDWIKYAKAAKNPLMYGSPGNGTSPHLTGELFKLLTGVPLTHVPYKGSSPALADLLGGHIDVTFDNLPSALPLVQSGKLRALAITGRERIPQLPDVPTAVESGIKDMVVDAWVGVMAPANLPPAITATLHKAILASVSDPEILKKLTERGITVRTSTPEEFRAYVKAENDKWEQVVRKSGAKID